MSCPENNVRDRVFLVDVDYVPFINFLLIQRPKISLFQRGDSMKRLPVIVGLVTVCLAMLVGIGATQDTKKEEKKAKGMLPPGFKDLNLTAEQKGKIYALQADYKKKIADLDKQIKDLRAQEFPELIKVLTDDQREKYLKAKGVEPKKDGDKEAKVDTAKLQVKSLTIACDQYRIKNKEYPESLNVLLQKDANGSIYIQDPNLLKDPWGKPYQYDASGPKNKGRHADIWTISPGPDKMEIGNWPK
jgi:Type II secretion system (T2SS), protein G